MTLEHVFFLIPAFVADVDALLAGGSQPAASQAATAHSLA